MLYTLTEIRANWASMFGAGEFVTYLRENFVQVYDAELNFIGYERA